MEKKLTFKVEMLVIRKSDDTFCSDVRSFNNLIKADSDFDYDAGHIVYGGEDGISIGKFNGYSYTVTDQTIKTYYARVSVNTASGLPVTDTSWKAWGTPCSDGITIVGGIKGIVINALTNAVVAGATINLYDYDNTLRTTTTSDTGTGNFGFVNVPIAQLSPNTSYHLSVTASGYGITSKSNIVVVIGENTDVGSIYIMPSGATASSITGSIIDANDGDQSCEACSGLSSFRSVNNSEYSK